MCKRLLVSQGHEVEEARDGLDGLQKYEEIAKRGGEVDLVLLDDHMPHLAGYEMAQRLREEQGYEEGVIVGVYEESVSRFKRSGANEVMSKPLDLQKLALIYMECLSYRVSDVDLIYFK